MKTILNSFSSILESKFDNPSSKSRFEWDELFFIITKIFSYRSSCIKTRQACLIVKNNRIISVGINGPPSGSLNCILEENGEEKCGKNLSGSCLLGIHAEQNCIGFASKNGISTNGCTIFCTETPCISCAKLIVSCGIKEFVYIKEYRLLEGLEFLKLNEIKVRKFVNE